MPGTEKNRSTSSGPPVVSSTEAGIYAIIGTKAFFSTCLTMMSLVGIPFTQARRM